METINIKYFKKTNDKLLYRLTDSNNKDIYLKFYNTRLPFNYQVYNHKLFINAELFKQNDMYDDNIQLINTFEDCIIKNMDKIIDNRENIKLNSVMKDRKMSKHIKCMLKRDNKNDILLTADGIDINKLTEYHKLDYRYDIVIKAEILWRNLEEYGVIFYMWSIILRQH